MTTDWKLRKWQVYVGSNAVARIEIQETEVGASTSGDLQTHPIGGDSGRQSGRRSCGANDKRTNIGVDKNHAEEIGH
jgi:hypothetical protein